MPITSTHATPRERAFAAALMTVALVLKVPYLSRYRFNSDEPQHLHVVWGWTQGMVQYRDFVDNHPPLFHLLMAPLLAAVGERADAPALMRVPMLALWAAALALTYLLARRLFSPRAALLAAALLAVHYEFFFMTTEFRTDNLWTLGWLAALVALAGGPLGPGRALAAAAWLGLAFAVSQKTVLLLVALVVAAAVVAVATARVRPVRRLAAVAAAGAAGLLAPPVAVAALLAQRQALRPALRQVITDNILPGLGHWGDPWRAGVATAGAAVAVWLAVRALRAGGDRPRAVRALVFLAGALYLLALHGVWPLVTGQDELPVLPLAAIAAVAGLQHWERSLAARGRPAAAPAVVMVALAVVEVGVLVGKGPVWRDHGRNERALLADVLRLTGRRDAVIDTKGETVFRRRAFAPVLETITIARLRRGLLPDTLAAAAVQAGCHVAVLDSPRFPPAGRAFLAANYLPVGRLRVSGVRLSPADRAGAPLRFSIAVAGRYVVVTPRGLAAGELDGTAGAGPRRLAAGRHEFRPAQPQRRLAVVWARAVERGFTPFAAAGGGR